MLSQRDSQWEWRWQETVDTLTVEYHLCRVAHTKNGLLFVGAFRSEFRLSPIYSDIYFLADFQLIFEISIRSGQPYR